MFFLANNSLYDNDTMIFMAMEQCSVSCVALGNIRGGPFDIGVQEFCPTIFFSKSKLKQTKFRKQHPKIRKI